MDVCQVAVVGAGPVGLLLAALLAQEGIDVKVLEQSPWPLLHSRAIGVHPPGLSALAEAHVAEALVDKGVRVRRAFAFTPRGELGRIDMTTLGGSYPFVLSVPQHETERALEARLRALVPGALLRGREVLDLRPDQTGVTLFIRHQTQETALRAGVVVGCDGKHSRVRRALGIRFPGGAYPGSYLMADLRDDTHLADAAAVFFTPEGLVESFPLPGGVRRWVVFARTERLSPEARVLCRLVEERTGHRLAEHTARGVSVFCAEHYLARRFVAGRVMLAGDAAHVVSPIGGQGMNLGLLDAVLLARLLSRRFARADTSATLASIYERTRRRAAEWARRRAELFMALGTARHLTWARDGFVRALLAQGMAPQSARLFTMQPIMRWA